jgi:hypothetical protein
VAPSIKVRIFQNSLAESQVKPRAGVVETTKAKKQYLKIAFCNYNFSSKYFDADGCFATQVSR